MEGEWNIKKKWDRLIVLKIKLSQERKRKKNECDESTFVTVDLEIRNKSPVDFNQKKHYIKYKRYVSNSDGNRIYSSGIVACFFFACWIKETKNWFLSHSKIKITEQWFWNKLFFLNPFQNETEKTLVNSLRRTNSGIFLHSVEHMKKKSYWNIETMELLNACHFFQENPTEKKML